MLKRFRPTPSGVIATIALVLAMSGGAYAAKRYLITSTKQISPSVLKALKGAAGKPGAAGATGSAGPAGQAGGVGPAGGAGTDGKEGKEGPQGIPGIPGKNGKEGSPWTANGTLPEGATETGTWSMGEVPAGSGPAFLKTAISFTIPLASPIAGANVHIFEGATIPPGCSGTPGVGHVTDLKAEPGNLCVWVASVTTAEVAVKASQITALNLESSEVGMGTHGGALNTFLVSEETAGEGVWAVTG